MNFILSKSLNSLDLVQLCKISIPVTLTLLTIISHISVNWLKERCKSKEAAVIQTLKCVKFKQQTKIMSFELRKYFFKRNNNKITTN